MLDSVIEANNIFRGSADRGLMPRFNSTRNPEASGVPKAAQLGALDGRN